MKHPQCFVTDDFFVVSTQEGNALVMDILVLRKVFPSWDAVHEAFTRARIEAARDLDTPLARG